MSWAADEGDVCVVRELPSELPSPSSGSFRTSITNDCVDRSSSLIPWGWSNHSIDFRESNRLGPTTDLDVSAVRRINSRSFLNPFDQFVELAGSELQPFTRLCQSVDDVLIAARQLGQSGWSKWVAKPEISHAGRNRLIMTSGEFNDQQAGWLNRLFRNRECVAVEPWVKLVSEGSLHFDIDPSGHEPQIRFVGMTGLLNDKAGRYRGSFFPFNVPESLACEKLVRQMLIDHGQKICEAARQEGYWGPIGLDFFLFEGPDGREYLRLCNDVNGRWTMGRLSLAVAAKVGAEAAFRWEYFAAGNSQNLERAIQKGLTNSGIRSVDILRTSPDYVGGRDVRLGNAAIWGASSRDVRLVAENIRACLDSLQTENSPQ